MGTSLVSRDASLEVRASRVFGLQHGKGAVVKTKYAPRSHAAKADLALGASIAKQLIPLRTAQSVADELGISRAMVHHIEYKALAKLAKAMRAARSAGLI